MHVYVTQPAPIAAVLLLFSVRNSSTTGWPHRAEISEYVILHHVATIYSHRYYTLGCSIYAIATPDPSPNNNICAPIIMQVMKEKMGNPDSERRAEFYQQPWCHEAVPRYFYSKVLASPQYSSSQEFVVWGNFQFYQF